jgi:hypothetical protein
MIARGVKVDHSTLNRWVVKYLSLNLLHGSAGVCWVGLKAAPSQRPGRWSALHPGGLGGQRCQELRTPHCRVLSLHSPRIPAVPFKANADRRHHIPKQRHRVTNWAEYDAALRQRGSLTIWFTDAAIAAWRAAPRTTCGGQPYYSALAITTARGGMITAPSGRRDCCGVSRRQTSTAPPVRAHTAPAVVRHGG